MNSLQTTFACALVLIAGSCVGVAWLTLRTHARLTRLKSRVDTMRLGFATLSQKLEHATASSAPAMLNARIDDLAAAVGSNSAATRRELGKLWRRVQKDFPVTTATDEIVGDEEFQALLELQNAPAARPNGRDG